MLFCIAPTVLKQRKKSITPIGIKKTALEMNSLVEIFNLEKNIFPPHSAGKTYCFYLKKFYDTFTLL